MKPMAPTFASLEPFTGIGPESTLDKVADAWRERTAKLFSDSAYSGHLENRTPRITEFDYGFLGRQLPLRAFINTRVAEEWYGNPTPYSELAQFHKANFPLVNTGDIVFDCGAHHGVYSMVFANNAGPDGRVIAFEPVPINAEIARLNADLNGFNTIDVIPVGLGVREEKISVSMQAHSTSTNNSADAEDVVQIQIATLDQFADYEPNFVKIDIEGAEVDALEGASRLLKQRPRLLVSVHPPMMAAFGRHPKEIFGLINEKDYEGFCLEGGKPIRPVDEDIDLNNYFDLFFLPKA